MSKFKNKRYRGFDSKLEEKRFQELLLLNKKGIINDLIKQPRFKIAESKKVLRNGRERVVREIIYIADFKYKKEGKVIVEDVKGFKTDVYKIKSKLFIAKMKEFGVDEFREVHKDNTVVYEQLTRKDDKNTR